MDPAHEFLSPYVYVGNSPIGFHDPNGQQAEGTGDLKVSGKKDRLKLSSGLNSSNIELKINNLLSAKFGNTSDGNLFLQLDGGAKYKLSVVTVDAKVGTKFVLAPIAGPEWEIGRLGAHAKAGVTIEVGPHGELKTEGGIKGWLGRIRIRDWNGDRVRGIESRNQQLRAAGAGEYDYGPANMRIQEVIEENSRAFDFSLKGILESIFGGDDEE